MTRGLGTVRPTLDTLEDRAVPAAFVSPNGVLVITGTAGRDIATVTTIPPGPEGAPPTFEVVLNGSAKTVVVPGGQILFYGYAGNDAFTNNSNLLAIAVGGEGNDVLKSGLANDYLDGGAGNDVLDGGAGNDILLTGAGNDVVWGGDGNDSMWGAAGRDSLHGGAGNDLIVGGAGDNKVWGDEGDDLIWAGGTANEVHGGAGNDLIVGGAGKDTVTGGGGTDSIWGVGGGDTFSSADQAFVNDFDAARGDRWV